MSRGGYIEEEKKEERGLKEVEVGRGEGREGRLRLVLLVVCDFFSRKRHAPGSQVTKGGAERWGGEGSRSTEGRTRVGEGLGILPIIELARQTVPRFHTRQPCSVALRTPR